MKVRLSPFTHKEFDPARRWFAELFQRVGSGPFLVQGYARANLPTAADWQASASDNAFSALIYVHDSTGTPAKILAYSDGTNWLRVDTGVAV